MVSGDTARVAARAIGVLALIVGLAAAALVAALLGIDTVGEIRDGVPSLLVAVMVIALIAAGLAPRLLRSRRLAAPFIGWLGAMISVVALIFVVGSASLLEFILRELIVPDLLNETRVGLFLTIWVGMLLLPAAAIAGTSWALLARVINRLVGRPVRELIASRQLLWRPSWPGFGRGALAIIALAVISLAVVSARAGRPDGSVCLDVGGESPMSGAWSPSGSMLAIASTRDLNERGTISLFEWPSQKVIARWPAWIEDMQTLAVDDRGRVYWMAHAMEPPWTSAVMTVAPGEIPTVVLRPRDDEQLLWDISLSAGELRGHSNTDHEPMRIPLAGSEAGTLRPLAMPVSPVGTMWWSPDGTWAVAVAEGAWTIAGEWESPVVVIGPDRTPARLALGAMRSPRRVAMTSDRGHVIASGWVEPSTITNVETGASQSVLHGHQRWIVVSERDDVAWANDESYARPGRPCVVSLAMLPRP